MDGDSVKRSKGPQSEAEVHVVSPQGAVDDWRNGYYTAHVEVAVAQDPNCIVIRGNRLQVIKCLVCDLNIEPSEVPDYMTKV